MSSTVFSLGVQYWPRRNRAELPLTWGEIDRGAVRDELAHLADIGFQTLVLDLRWESLQPSPTRVYIPALNALEQVLDAAQSNGLRAHLKLMSASLAGALALPSWAVGMRPDDPLMAARFGHRLVLPTSEGPPIFTSTGFRREPVRDLYHDPEQLEAQRYLLREVLGNFARHPAAHSWQIASDFERVRRPAQPSKFVAWWRDLSERIARYQPQNLYAPLSLWGVSRRDTLRPSLLAERCSALVIAAQPADPLAVRDPWRANYVRFAHALASGLLRSEGSKLPVLISDVGLAARFDNRSAWVEHEEHGRSSQIYLADREQQASFAEEVLADLYRDGAAGIWFGWHRELPAEQWMATPLQRNLRWRAQGILAADGNELPIANAIRTFAQRLRSGTLSAPAAAPSLPLDPERYWHQPDKQLGQLYEGVRY